MNDKFLHDLYSVRMRASKTVRSQESGVGSQESESKIQNPKSGEMHISGAEGIYELSDIDRVIKGYYQRAINHPRGLPDRVVITVEKLIQTPDAIKLLPVTNMKCNTQDNVRKIIKNLLIKEGVSEQAIQHGIKVVYGKKTMRGAAIIMAESGVRIEPHRNRGVRVSMLGMDKDLEKALSRKLSKAGINTTTVKEALVLASKVASCRGVIAELCISDDPDYTTGYVASRAGGYIRIPDIKQKGSLSGGRVFFIKEKADVRRIIDYLEEMPVIAVTRFY